MPVESLIACQYCVQFILRGENHLGGFANCTTATAAAGLPECTGGDSSAAIGHGHAQSNAVDHRKVWQVVTHKGDFVHLDIHGFQQFTKGGKLVFAALNHRENTQLIGAALQQFGDPPGNNTDLHATALQQFNTQTILNIEGLELFAIVAVVEMTVGENAVDIEQQQFDFFGSGDDCAVYLAHY